jgi:hypothetical protein
MNVTFQFDDELLRQAKKVAARRNTSVASVVRQGLEQQVAIEKPLASPGAQGAYEALVDYSLGRVPRRVAMEALGLEDYGDLLAMLGASGLSQPIVPAAERAKMVKDMLSALSEAGVRVERQKP